MTAPTTQQIASVLREHRIGETEGGTATGSACPCSCGEQNWINSTRDMAARKARTHVAEQLAALFDQPETDETLADLHSRLACVLEATYWDRPYETRIAAIRGMCDLTTNGLTPAPEDDWQQPETSGIEYGLAVARDLLQKVADYWEGRPCTHHGDQIMADLLAVLRAITPADDETDDGMANTCTHMSASGVDTAPLGPDKVWRCDHCGLTWKQAQR